MAKTDAVQYEQCSAATNEHLGSMTTSSAYMTKRPAFKAYFGNVIIFLAGTLASLLFYEFLHGQLGGLLPNFQNKQLQHLPSSRYLQARDDFAIYNPDEAAALKAYYSELMTVHDVDDDEQDKSKDNKANVKEALGSLRLAQDMRVAGKKEKAEKLFEHAFALAPKHPEVLLRYGEYLEQNQNVILADQYYFQVSYYTSAKII